jgi:hypothetical protein
MMATYRRGSRGSGVADLQSKLRSAGYDIAADGIYGPKTAAAVRDFQAKSGIAADAIAGKQTMGKLNERLNRPQASTQREQQDVSYSDVLNRLNNQRFSYSPGEDKALQADIAFTNRQIRESMNERGILYSELTGEEAQSAALGLTAQYRNQAYNRWVDKINMRRQEINDAMSRVQTMGYVDNYASKVLGIAPGTPSFQAKQAANEFQQKLALMKADYEFRREYSQANRDTGAIVFPVQSQYVPKSPGSPELIERVTMPRYDPSAPAWEQGR